MAKSSVKFLADQNISQKLIAILNHLGEKSISSIYRTDMVDWLDPDWLPEATRRGYICVTCDSRMAVELGTAQILINERARVIFFGEHFAGSRKWEQALWLLKHWREIRSFAQGMVRGQLVRVNKNGSIVGVVPGKKRRAFPSRVAMGRKLAAKNNNGVLRF